MSPSTILPPTHMFKPGGLSACGLPTNIPAFPVIITDEPSIVTCGMCLSVIEYQTAEKEQS